MALASGLALAGVVKALDSAQVPVRARADQAMGSEPELEAQEQETVSASEKGVALVWAPALVRTVAVVVAQRLV
jgi:hypothetical protein